MRTAALLGLIGVMGVCTWLAIGTPSSLVTGQPSRLGPQPRSDTVVIHIDNGDSADTIANKLQQSGVIESARLFRVLTSLMGVGDKLEAGEYEFAKGESTAVIVQRISHGITASRSVTIPEGLRSEEIGVLLEREGVVPAQDFTSALSDGYSASFLNALLPGRRLEGFLFPATYGTPQQLTAHDMVQQMLAAFDQRYKSEIQPLLPSTRLSLLEIVTLASIIEREAQIPSERPIIASVFLNRLAAGVPLQADPTVQYAAASDPASVARYGYWKQELTANDLSIDSPYNTYVRPGLPPGPIANPGLSSILAVLKPAQTDYLYFVARTDGSHAFATTLEEHRRNVCNIDPTRPECP
jgi:UPF0755 protein